jgi:hypothetical protein
MFNKLPRVTGLQFLEDYRVQLTFTDGFAGAVDLKPVMAGPIFGPLWNTDLFRRVAVRHGTLAWPNNAELCPDVLRYWCEIGRVCSQAEMDAAFAAGQRARIIANERQTP